MYIKKYSKNSVASSNYDIINKLFVLDRIQLFYTSQ